MKLYFGSPSAIVFTILLLVNIFYVVWVYSKKAPKDKWGLMIAGLIVLNGAMWFFANSRDLYNNSMMYAIDGSTADGLFSLGSIQSIGFWVINGLMWVAGIISIFLRKHRKVIFTMIVVLAAILLVFIEGSRIMLYLQSPDSFNYMG